MSEKVLNATGASATGIGPAPRKSINLMYFDWLYILIGLSILVFGPLTLYYPKSYEDVWTPASSLNTTDVAIIALLGVLIAVFGFLDWRNTRSKSNKLYFVPVIIVLGIVLVPLYTYYGAFNGLLGNSYDLSGLGMAGILLIFAGLSQIYLMRKPPMQM
ncbi:MAG: hypothetical protein JRN33_04060 [Nitrososphaerota archaeon]|nr:hypothetical protein [Nitrososphaerota archaeon]MDG6955376.1 hypothetical protein [Nitrososphaerota archaeon]